MVSGDIVVDSSLLINFLRVGRVDLLGAYPADFMVPDEVTAEVTWPDQAQRLREAFDRGDLVRCTRDDKDEDDLYTLFRPMGAGECSAIAIALSRGCRVAMEDIRAIKAAQKRAWELGKELEVVKTRDILGYFVDINGLTRDEADALVEKMG